MKKIICIFILSLTAFVLTSCTNQTSQVAETSNPVSTPIQTTAATATVQPITGVTPQQTAKPEVTPQKLIKDDIPAYLAVGLDKRSEMRPELERFYYTPYYIKISTGPYSDLVKDDSETEYFNKTTSVDLNGDGKEETIKIIGGKPYDKIADKDPSYFDITVDIDGNQLKLKNDSELPFTLDGKILDIDKNDGKKEILIEASLILQGQTDYVISYESQTPTIIFAGELESAMGAGYITTPEIYDTGHDKLFYYELWKIKSDRSGFEPADNTYYPTLYQEFCWDEYGNWDEGKAAPTQSEQFLYTEPDGTEQVKIEKGTRVFIGLYAKKGWFMILDAKGELLGWLNADEVNLGEYTNNAFQPEGD